MLGFEAFEMKAGAPLQCLCAEMGLSNNKRWGIDPFARDKSKGQPTYNSSLLSTRIMGGLS